MSFLLEKYDPLYLSSQNELMTKKIRPGKIGFPALTAFVVIISLAATLNIHWLYALIALPFSMLIGASMMPVENNTLAELRPFNRKRVHSGYTDIWAIVSDADAMKDRFLRDKVTEYFDAIRAGAERSRNVEHYIRKIAKVVRDENDLLGVSASRSADHVIDNDALKARETAYEELREMNGRRHDSQMTGLFAK